MEIFKSHLQQEFLKRLGNNPSYSLRAYAQHLNINHATLSTILSGKRKITKATVLKLAKNLNLSPEEINHFLNFKIEEALPEEKSFYLLQNDIFSFISEWYFDAILELSLISQVKLNPQNIASILGIPVLQATFALDTLVRLELLTISENGKYLVTHKNSTNILDHDTTTSAQLRYQRSILEKSLQALENIERKKRDHSSVTMAINPQDLPEAKELIKKFRHDLNAFMQRVDVELNEVYQLQVSFFPLSSTGLK
jgi:uncharacterized protein (TIGR02147 family)